jgi:hypothetical protein
MSDQCIVADFGFLQQQTSSNTVTICMSLCSAGDGLAHRHKNTAESCITCSKKQHTPAAKMLLSPHAAVSKQHPQLLHNNPKLDFMLRMHSVVHDAVAARHELVPAPTRVSDATGVYERRSSDQRTLLRVQVGKHSSGLSHVELWMG